MKTLYITSHATKKRTNSKKWDWQEAEYSFTNPLQGVSGCSVRDEKSWILQRVYVNVPSDMTIDDCREVVRQAIVMTPMGQVLTHYDFAVMLQDRDAAMNAGNFDGQFPGYVHHPKPLA